MTTNTNEQEEQKRKPGRPRKMRNFIVYRSGRKLKAYNTDLCIDMIPNEREITGAITIYKGLGEDHVAWGRKLTRDGDYNIAQGNPFRPLTSSPTPVQMQMLERDYREYPQLHKVMDALKELFDQQIPFETIELSGAKWMRTLGHVFVREAGVDGISRNQYKRPEGKIYAAVNVLESQGAGVNYTLETWRAVCHMFLPPVFCIRMSGEETPADDIPEGWTPKDLANAILHSLYATKGVNSCSADAPVASGEATPSLQASETIPPPESHPDAVPAERGSTVLEDNWRSFRDNPMGIEGVIPHLVTQEVLEPEVLSIEPTIAEATPEPKYAAIPEPTPTPSARTWGEIKATPIWMKGLTSSKELQAPAPLSRILESVVSHEATKRLTDECRAITDKKERNEYKRDNLHVWYPSAVFAGRAGGSTKENLTGYTGLACLDFDGMKTPEEAQDARDDIFMQFPEVLFAAVSASGLGVYALVTLEFDGTEAGFKAALSGAMESFEAHGYMPDTGCSDPTRARYMSSDPDALQRPDAYVPKAFSASGEGGFILPATMLRSCWTNSGRKKKGAGKLYLEEALRRIETAPEGSKDTTITSVMGSVARLIRNYDLNAEQVYDKVRQVARECGYCERKTNDKIRRLGVKNTGGGL